MQTYLNTVDYIPLHLFTYSPKPMVFLKEEEGGYIEKKHSENFQSAGDILFLDLGGVYLYIYYLYTFPYMHTYNYNL